MKVRQSVDGSPPETFYLSKGAMKSALKGEHEVLGEVTGRELVDLTYRGPFDELPVAQNLRHRVVAWDEVSDAEGTGIVHIAPGCGKEDFQLSKEFALDVIAPVDDEGVYVDGFASLTGASVTDNATRDTIFESLRNKRLMYRTQQYAHRYPHCWRCGTELIFRLVDEWFISMDQLRHQIADVTRQIRWIPDFGLARELDWLKNMDDWMISKKRYYGLALPIFDCEQCGAFEVIGSEQELRERAVEGWDVFEGHSPHKPFIDAVKIKCAFVRRARLAHPRRRQPLARRRHRPVLDAALPRRPCVLGAVVPGALHHRGVPRPVPQLVLLAADDVHRAREPSRRSRPSWATRWCATSTARRCTRARATPSGSRTPPTTWASTSCAGSSCATTRRTT